MKSWATRHKKVLIGVQFHQIIIKKYWGRGGLAHLDDLEIGAGLEDAGDHLLVLLLVDRTSGVRYPLYGRKGRGLENHARLCIGNRVEADKPSAGQQQL